MLTLIFLILGSIIFRAFLLPGTGSLSLDSGVSNYFPLSNDDFGQGQTVLEKEGWSTATPNCESSPIAQEQTNVEYFPDKYKNVLEKEGWTNVTQEHLNDIKSGKNTDYSVLFYAWQRSILDDFVRLRFVGRVCTWTRK